MEPSRPSRTALRVALRRAAHQLYDAKPIVFNDPYAVPLLGKAYAEELKRTPKRGDRPHSAALRAWLVARSRFVEDHLIQAVGNGVTQYVVLGAGLDTFALRNPFAGLRVFEVDHPATQAWKRKLIANAGLSLREGTTFVPVDFEKQSLREELRRAGLLPERVFFAWLGVVPYMVKASFEAVLEGVARSARGSAIVMDYGQPRDVLPPLERLAHDSLAARVRLAGEPFQLFLTPEDMAEELHAFSEIEDVGDVELNERYFGGRSDNLRILGEAARLVWAKV